MSEIFNPRIEVHNGEGLTITLRPDEKKFSTLDGKESEIVLSFNDEDVGVDDQVKYKNNPIGKQELAYEVFGNVGIPKIVAPADGSRGWYGDVSIKLNWKDGLDLNFSTVIEVSTNNDFSNSTSEELVGLHRNLNFTLIDSIPNRTYVYVRVYIKTNGEILHYSNVVRVRTKRMIKVRDKEHLIKLINDNSIWICDLDTSLVTDLSRFWISENGTPNITRTSSFYGFSTLDVSNVTNFDYCFGHETVESDFGSKNCQELSNWRGDSGESFVGFFMNCKSLVSYTPGFILPILDSNNENSTDPEDLGWNIHDTGDTHGSKVLRLPFLITNRARNLSFFFSKCIIDCNNGMYPLGIGTSAWNVSSVTNFSNMFSYSNAGCDGIYGTGANDFENISYTGNSIGNWDMRNAENIESMFKYAETGVFLCPKYMPKVTSYESVCEGVLDLVYMIGEAKTSKVTNFRKAFLGSHISARIISSYTSDYSTYGTPTIDLSSAEDLDYFLCGNGTLMYKLKSSLKKEMFNNVRTAKYAFALVEKMSPRNTDESNLTLNSNATFSKLTNSDFMFANNVIDFTSTIITWNLSNLESMKYMFCNTDYNSYSLNTMYGNFKCDNSVTYNRYLVDMSQCSLSRLTDAEGAFSLIPLSYTILTETMNDSDLVNKKSIEEHLKSITHITKKIPSISFFASNSEYVCNIPTEYYKYNEQLNEVLTDPTYQINPTLYTYYERPLNTPGYVGSGLELKKVGNYFYEKYDSHVSYAFKQKTSFPMAYGPVIKCLSFKLPSFNSSTRKNLDRLFSGRPDSLINIFDFSVFRPNNVTSAIDMFASYTYEVDGLWGGRDETVGKIDTGMSTQIWQAINSISFSNGANVSGFFYSRNIKSSLSGFFNNVFADISSLFENANLVSTTLDFNSINFSSINNADRAFKNFRIHNTSNITISSVKDFDSLENVSEMFHNFNSGESYYGATFNYPMFKNFRFNNLRVAKLMYALPLFNASKWNVISSYDFPLLEETDAFIYDTDFTISNTGYSLSSLNYSNWVFNSLSNPKAHIYIHCSQYPYMKNMIASSVPNESLQGLGFGFNPYVEMNDFNTKLNYALYQRLLLNGVISN